jgi:hypothetical protein
MHRAAAIGLIVAVAGAGVLAQAQSNPLSTDVRKDYQTIKDYFIRAAEKMPEAVFGFKPSPDVRSFAQQVAHVADDQYNLCAPAKGRLGRPHTAIESSLSRGGPGRGARDAFKYCDGACDALTDASAAQPSAGKTKFEMLNWNLWHTWSTTETSSCTCA